MRCFLFAINVLMAGAFNSRNALYYLPNLTRSFLLECRHHSLIGCLIADIRAGFLLIWSFGLSLFIGNPLQRDNCSFAVARLR